MAILAGTFVPMLASATIVSTSVQGAADVYLAGRPNGSAEVFDSAPTNSPTLVGGITLLGGHTLTFTTTGATNGAGCASADADGCGNFATSSTDTNISAYTGPAQALIGLFLGADAPATMPAGLDFTDHSFASLAPGLGVVFFIGDGLTGDGTGTTQTFTVPTGATRLFLASSDSAGSSYDNAGEIDVAVNDGVVAAAPPTTSIPEPSTVGLLSLGVAGFVVRRRRITRAG